MKKILSILGLIVFASGLVLAFGLPANAATAPTGCNITHNLDMATCPDGSGGAVACQFDDATQSCGVCCLLNSIYTVTDWIFVVLIAVAAFFVLLGAFNLVTAGGDPGKVTSGRNYILYAAIGLAVAFLAKAMPSVVKTILGA